MDNNILSSIRTAKGFNRSVTLLVILALLGLMLERVIYYTLNENDVIEDENVVEKMQRMAPHKARQLGLPASKHYTPAPQTAETRFSRSVRDIKEKLAFMDVDYRDVNIDQLAIDINDLRQTLVSLDKDVKAGFAETAEHIRQRQLAGVILQRHADAVSKYEQEFNILMTKLAAVDTATSVDDKKDKLNQVKNYLAKQQFKRSQQAFDPDKLPFNSVKPNPDNKPKIHQNDFAAAGLFNNPQQKLAALGDFTFDALPGATDPAYLAETDEVVLTQAIRDQAEALNYDPVQIYHWVLNNVEWLPTWGSIQDSDITLGSQKGNALDIASLLVALLRASQIPARYVHGTIDVPEEKFRNWAGGFESIEAAMDFAASGGIPITGLLSGGQIKTVRMEHVWVEAAIDYQPSRGAKNIDADSWVQMDGSYKQYDHLQGLDVAQIAGLDADALAQSFIDSGTVNDAEGWVSGFDPTILQSAQQQAQTALENHITTNMTDPTVGDVIGGKRTIIKQHPVLPSSLQNRIVVTGSRYGTLPAALQQTMTFSLGKDALGYPVNPITVPWVRLNNHKVTLSFRPATPEDEQTLLSLLPEGEITDISQLPSSIPAYLINVIPELKIDGQRIHAGNQMVLGAELDFGFDTQLVGRGTVPKRYTLPAGSFLSIAAIGGSVSAAVLSDLQTQLTETQTKLQSADPTIIDTLTREDLLGDMFHAGSLGYYAQYISFSYLAGLQSGAHNVLAGGTGSFGYEPEVDYFFGMPRTVTQGGIALNKPIINIVGENAQDIDSKTNYTLQIGMISSALEHITPEQMFTDVNNPGEAISAVRALQKATAQGQRIYQISQQNQATTLPNIHHDPATLDEIRNAIGAGKEVITHTDAVSVPGWSGAGYIILDPETGSGAYKIGGGLNGAVLAFIIFAVGMIIGTLLVVSGSAILVGGVIVLWESFGFASWIYAINVASDYEDLNQANAGAFIIGALGLMPTLGVADALAAKLIGMTIGTLLTNPFGAVY